MNHPDPVESGDAAALRSIRQRYLALNAMRWLPNGFLLPVFTLVWLDRGLTVGQIGLAFAVQGFTVFLLELPTGGMADALGRRPVLLGATLLDAVALSVALVARSVEMFAVVALLMGVYRALESGPLDAWLVDAVHEVDPRAELEPILGKGGVATGLAIASGSLIASGLVAIGPVGGVDVLVLPIVVAIVFRVVDVAAIAVWMSEPALRTASSGFGSSVRNVPAVVSDTVRQIRSSRVLTALVLVELFWGFGMVTFETFVPIRLGQVAGGNTEAATLFGPAATVAWVVSAAGSALATTLARRLGTAIAAMCLHAVQAASVAAMALLGGPLLVIGAYLVTIGSHGTINPLYKSLLHAHAKPTNRTTVLSAASMLGHPGFAIGGIVLGLVADRATVTTAMVVGACVLLFTIPLYLPARR